MPMSSPRSRFSACSFRRSSVADHLHRLVERRVVVAAVVLPSGGALVGELVGTDEVSFAEFRRVAAQVVGQDVGHALDHVHGFGDPEGAAIGDAARRLGRVDAVDLDVGGLHVVAAGADGVEAGRELRRVGRRVGGAVVGQGLHLEAGDACPRRRRPSWLRCGNPGRSCRPAGSPLRSSIHLTGLPVTSDATAQQT